jgi:uncharacterized protein
MRLGPKRTIRILSIDGGGIRGYIPALVLAELERRLRERGRPAHLGRLFDLIAGTSTGSIIALGLAAPKELPDKSFSKTEAAFTAEEIADMYEDHGLEIFPRRIFKQYQTMRHAFTEKYNDGQFQEVLQEHFGKRTVWGGITNLLITCFDIEKHEPVMIKKVPPKRVKPSHRDYYMSDTVRASSAAPTYFEPIRIRSVDGSVEHSLVDGGVFANNPAMCAYVEAQKIFPRAKRFIILSLGTGIFSRGWTYEQVKNWGVLEWIQPSKGVPIATIMNKGQGSCVDHQLDHLPGVEYHRINIPVGPCSRDMDDAAPENIRCLKERAQEAVKNHEESMDRLVSVLG